MTEKKKPGRQPKPKYVVAIGGKIGDGKGGLGKLAKGEPFTPDKDTDVELLLARGYIK